MRNICVYCGASKGNSILFEEGAKRLAQELHSQNLGLVYGGGDVGLMGVIADEMLRLGGKVTGVIPSALMDKEVGHDNLTQLYVVHNMHERKAMMAELSDGFIAMPGGIGTLEEMFEVFTWLQLGFHTKPLGILNVGRYYDGLLQFLRQAVDTEFLKPAHLDLLIVETDPALMLERFREFQPPSDRRWLTEMDI
jgi:uncharacterized protein (TIGR00730 family)